MTDAKLFRQYAEEFLGFAKTAKTEGERKTFIDMARTWTQAAMQADDNVTLPPELAQSQPAPH